MLEANNIYNQDCIRGLKQLDDSSVDLIVADPPYFKVTKEKWDNQWETPDEYLFWCEQWINECRRVLKPTGSLYVWGMVGEKSDMLIHLKLLIDGCGLHFKDWITWKKQRGLGNRRGWLYTREEVLWYVKDNKQFFWNADNQYSDEKRGKSSYGYILKNGKSADDYIKSEYKRITNVWTDISESTFNTSQNNLAKLHYTPKPLKAIERIISLHAKPGDLVVDPFMGSGTTAIAARNQNVNYIGFEVSGEYCELAKNRLENGSK